MTRLRNLGVALLAVLALAGCQTRRDDGPLGNVGVEADWPNHNGDAAETAFSRLDQINRDTVKRLGLAFSLDLPGETTLEATPIAVAGKLYFTGTHAQVYAVDGKTGQQLWKYDPETWKRNPWMLTQNFAANRGAAFADGRIFAASLDGRLFALDAATGKLVWETQTVPPQSHQFITGAPRVFRGKVIIGQAGADFGERGFVAAYDQATGKQVWRFYVTPGSPEENKGDPAQEAAAKTWNGEWWKTGTGGGPWDDMTFDEELGRVYVGTGNVAPVDPKTRWQEQGDNLYTAGIVALEADSGKYVWHYQENPRDSWDYDSTQQITLVTLPIDGKPRKILLHAPKNGFLYAIDRNDGKVVSAEKIVKVTWASHIDLKTGRPAEEKDIRYENGDVTIWPNPAGAHSWQAQSWSPRTGLIYIPVTQNGVRYSQGEPIPGGVFVGGVWIGSEKQDERDGKGSLLAWDPVTQKQAWIVPHQTMYNGGVLSTAGNLVFQGIADGTFSAYDAASGKQLWTFDAGLGIISSPMSYAIDGKQYIALLVGWGGSSAVGSDVMNVGWKYGANPRRLLVFALDGTAKLPPGARPTLTVDAQDNPSIQIDAVQAKAGYDMWMACALCHGRDAISSGAPGPDLRESALALDQDAFLQVVKGGALLEKGMPRYDQLSREQAIQLWHYVRQQARLAKTRAAGKAPGG
ncbi:MAG: PQQ-dependent dehydrogenase, methanol/ethanol family [Novosphingobium sp.]